MTPFDREDIEELLAEMGAEPSLIDRIDGWLQRGDGCAVYRNEDLGCPDLGMLQLVSFGSDAAQIPGEPPDQMPDIGDSINWRYRLLGTYRP